jgi:Phosphate-starvation-inducible E family
MRLTEELEAGRQRWRRLTVYLKFEHAVVLILTAVISVIIVAAMWKLAVKVVVSLVLSNTLDLTDLAEFQSVFGMVFTVIIALEFKRTLVLVTERTERGGASPRRNPDRAVGDRPQVDHSRHLARQCAGAVGVHSGDPLARWRLLAGQGPRQTEARIVECLR